MSDPRHTQLANTLIRYSCDLQPGEHLLIEAVDIPHEFTCELIRLAREVGGHPNVFLKSKSVMRRLLMDPSDEQLEAMAKTEEVAMEQADAYIGMRGSANVSELSDVPGDAMDRFEKKIWQRVHTDIRVAKTKWVVLRWPTPSMAQLAGQSTESFEDAVKKGVARASQTLHGVQGQWIQEQTVVVADGLVTEYRVNMKVTFILD